MHDRRSLTKHYINYTKLTQDECEALLSGRSIEVPFSSEEAKSKGLVDTVIGGRRSI